MNRIYSFVVALIVVSALFVPVASAQENTTAIDEPGESDEPDEPEYLEQIDDRTQLLEWEYRDGEFRLRFNATVAVTLTITEAVQFQEGTGQGTIHQQTIPAGESTVTVPIAERNGKAGATITTARSIGQSRFTYVSTGQTETSESPFERTSSTAGWIGGAGTVGLMFSVVAWRELRKEPDAPEVVK